MSDLDKYDLDKSHVGEVEDFIDGLRAIADFYSAHTELPLPQDLGLYVWLSEFSEDKRPVRVRLAEWARALGRADKYATDSAFGLQRLFGGVQLKVLASRESVCVARQIGTRIVPAQEEREVPVYEWDCDPILAGVEEVAGEDE